jgi:hypothetical protein
VAFPAAWPGLDRCGSHSSGTDEGYYCIENS